MAAPGVLRIYHWNKTRVHGMSFSLNYHISMQLLLFNLLTLNTDTRCMFHWTNMEVSVFADEFTQYKK